MFAMTAVLVCLGYYNRIPYTVWLINNINLFLTVLKAEKPKVKAPADSVDSEVHFLAHRWPSFHCILTWWKGDESSLRFPL